VVWRRVMVTSDADFEENTISDKSLKRISLFADVWCQVWAGFWLILKFSSYFF
jgi:hypothetical protein